LRGIRAKRAFLSIRGAAKNGQTQRKVPDASADAPAEAKEETPSTARGCNSAFADRDLQQFCPTAIVEKQLVIAELDSPLAPGRDTEPPARLAQCGA